MLQSTLISPATGSLAAIVGTPPAAQRSAGDGGAAPDSFAMALNQASSPPPPAAPSPTAPERQEPRADAAPAKTATTDERPDSSAENATTARVTGQRKAVAATAGALDEKSAAAALAAAPASAATGAGVLTSPAQDAPDADRTGDPGDAAPDAGSLLAALLGGTPAATDRLAAKASLPSANAAGVAGASVAARGGAAPAMEAASAAATGALRRGEAGVDAPGAPGDRDAALRATAPAAAAAAAAGPSAAAPASPLHAAPPLLSAVATNTNNAAVVEARLQASPGSAEFAPTLGAQLNVFLREGVQHARLHLNPAELGPLTVQIQLDGVAAQVRLAAEHPLTRQALEQAMPLLAGTLRESGLTLTGGGVFEQPANPQPQTQTQQEGRASPGERTAGSREGRDPAVQADGAPPRLAFARRGVVDLVA